LQEKLDEADTGFKAALTIAKATSIREMEWRCLYGMGQIAAVKKDLVAATEHLSAAIAVIEQLRAAIKVEEFKEGFVTDKQDVYQDLAVMLLNQGKTEEALACAERARGRNFIDLLGNNRLELGNGADQKLLTEAKRLKGRIQEGEELLGSADDAMRPGLLKELETFRKSYGEVLIEIKAQNPELSSFVSVEPMTAKDIQGLLEPGVALAEYLVTKKEVIAWVATREKIVVRRMPKERAELELEIKNYRALTQNLEPLDAESKALFELLVAPIQEDLKGTTILGIVPDGALHYLSFASLDDGKGSLLERYPLFHIPSASVLRYTEKKRRVKVAGKIKALAIGNPDLGTRALDLPFAEKEVGTLRWNLGEVTELTREKATETWVEKHIGEFDIIHLASHGEFDPVNPLFSALKLAKDKQNDGNLEANEVFALKINADLVTLSACQTGLGKIQGGGEVIGLNRAFLYAGTHTIISSLWRVSDVSTAIMVKNFYRGYADAEMNKAQALRRACLLVKKDFPHPSYWAAFVLTGDYQ